jgi:hypothetical protein
MDRRTFVRRLAAAGAACVLSAPSAAATRRKGGSEAPTHGRVVLRVGIEARSVAIDRLFWLDPGAPLTLGLAADQPMFVEDRLDLGALPGADLVLRPALRRRLTGAEAVADVGVAGTALLLRPPVRVVPPERVVIAHRATSWEPPGALVPPGGGRLPAFGDIPAIGRAFRTREDAPGGGALIVLVRPTIAEEPGS